MCRASNNSYYSSQYATTTPKMFSVNSMATNCPRDLCSAVSVAQTGTIAFRIPVPHPLIRRALDHQLYNCQFRSDSIANRRSSKHDSEQKFEE